LQGLRIGEITKEAPKGEERMAIGGERTEAMRDDARRMRDGVRRENLEEKLGEVVKERPGVRPFLEMRPLLIALAIAAVLTLIVSLLASVALGALVLVVSFGIAWVVLSKRSYEERRPTSDANEEEDDSETPGKGDSEVAPFSS
jgi:Flp pilus assembly protein TadB